MEKSLVVSVSALQLRSSRVASVAGFAGVVTYFAPAPKILGVRRVIYVFMSVAARTCVAVSFVPKFIRVNMRVSFRRDAFLVLVTVGLSYIFMRRRMV